MAADPGPIAVSRPGWRWLDGMRATGGVRYAGQMRWNPDWLPDLDDACTVGGLLDLVRDYQHDPQAYCGPAPDDSPYIWALYAHGEVVSEGRDEVEALIGGLQ